MVREVFCVLAMLAATSLTGCASRMHSVTVSGRITSITKNPVEGVMVTVRDFKGEPRRGIEPSVLAETRTTADGAFSFNLNVSTTQNLEVWLTRSNYTKFAWCHQKTNHWNLPVQYYSNPDSERKLAASGKELEQAVREVLAGYWITMGADWEVLFVREDKIRPALKALVNDPKLDRIAKSWLERIEIEDVPTPRFVKGKPLPRSDSHPQGAKPSDAPDASVIADEDPIKAIELAGYCLSPGARNFGYSGIVFNPTRDKALVAAHVVNGPLAGGGYDLVFHKRDGKWTLIKIISTWLS